MAVLLVTPALVHLFVLYNNPFFMSRILASLKALLLVSLYQYYMNFIISSSLAAKPRSSEFCKFGDAVRSNHSNCRTSVGTPS